MELLQSDPAVELTREHVFTHSKAGAVNGTIKQTSGKTYAFCDVVEFNTTKAAQIKRITF